MRPCALSVLKQELAADLLEIAAFEDVLACAYALEDGLYRVDEQVAVYVGRFCAEVEGARHAEIVVDLARGVCVDGERTRGRLSVHWYQLGATAADDGYEGRCREREKVIGFDGGGDGTQIFLAVLLRLDVLLGRLVRTYTTEEMADEDDQLSRRDMRCLVQVLERPALSLRIQHKQIVHLLQVLFRRQIIIDIHRTLKLLLLFFQNWCLASWRERRSGLTRCIY